MPGGGPLSVIYVDTEGFESTGKSDAYDDRIFALSALLSSVLMCGPQPCSRGLATVAPASYSDACMSAYRPQASTTLSARPAGVGLFVQRLRICCLHGYVLTATYTYLHIHYTVVNAASCIDVAEY